MICEERLDEPAQMMFAPSNPVEDYLAGNRMRFLLYCHDTFGLGHLRRALLLATHFTETWSNAEVLMVTGSPLAHSFALPARVDYVKLPVVTKMTSGDYRARNLDLEFSAIRDLRATILRETAQAYRPNVFLVDHAPQGLKGEALPTLAMLKHAQPQCLRVLGLRDIVDTSQVIQKTWREEGIYQTLEQDYDLILVYGSRRLYDIAEEYRLSARIEQRIRYCGYLDRIKGASPSTQAIQTLPAFQPLVALTAGGGGDGFPLMRDYLLGLQQLKSIQFSSVLLTGPLMDEAEQNELRRLATGLPAGKVRIESFLPDPLPVLRAADLVVAMAGYNTICELLALKKRMLLVPRTAPRQEQLIRASLLAQRGLAHMLSPERLTPEALMKSVQHALLQPRPEASQLAAAGISFDGQTLASQAILEELYHRNTQSWTIERVTEHVV